MKQTHKEILFIALISGIIASLVSLPVVLMNQQWSVRSLVFSFAIGLSIGLMARQFFVWLFLHLNSRPLICFIAVAIIIAAGTFLGAWISPYHYWKQILLMIGLGEAFGMVFTFVMWRQSKRLNNALHERQQQLRKK